VTGGALEMVPMGRGGWHDDDQPDGQIAAATVAMIEKLGDTPWFIGCGFMKPHDPFIAPKKYFDLYPPESLKPWTDPADITPRARKPWALASMARPSPSSPTRNGASCSEPTSPARASWMRNSAACSMRSTSTSSGTRRSSSSSAITATTPASGKWWNKNTLFERSCRAPLVIAAPGMKGGQTSRSLVEFVDLYPTVADFCGLKMPHAAAGASLRPVLADPTASIKDAAFTLVTRGPKLHGQSVRTARWRFTLERWPDRTLRSRRRSRGALCSGKVEKVDGKVPLRDGAAFAIPAGAFPDQKNFTVQVTLSVNELRRQIAGLPS
jgi:iduronate 2-sulfatase